MVQQNELTITIGGNWQWRMTEDELRLKRQRQELLSLTTIYRQELIQASQKQCKNQNSKGEKLIRTAIRTKRVSQKTLLIGTNEELYTALLNYTKKNTVQLNCK